MATKIPKKHAFQVPPLRGTKKLTDFPKSIAATPHLPRVVVGLVVPFARRLQRQLGKRGSRPIGGARDTN
eukprot:SAG31_NODE_22211_length_531_cov_0.997685_1_plen_69_part_10